MYIKNKLYELFKRNIKYFIFISINILFLDSYDLSYFNITKTLINITIEIKKIAEFFHQVYSNLDNENYYFCLKIFYRLKSIRLKNIIWKDKIITAITY